MTRTSKRLTAGAILAIAIAAAIFAPIIAKGQDRGAQPAIAAIEARLGDRRATYNARVNSEIDDDLLEKGRLVAMGGSQAGGSGMACISCHGAEGQGDGSGAFPRLTGQPGWYMYKQLQDYASGARPNNVMSGVARRLTDDEMEAVSAYYAALRAPARPTLGEVDGAALQWGGQLGAVGSAERGIPACVNCHGPKGMGNAPSVPYLAGQYAGYMEYQLKLWKDGTRDNDTANVMSAIASKMTAEDMQAVSEYYARVRPAAPKDTAAPGAMTETGPAE